ncbi:ankyrin repeat domain-containing protein, partial [Escherichia coli]|nr:ankyrin repeat domain-containing protein [Escherichia coli]
HTWGYRNTSLHLAAFFGMPTLVQLLLDLGADPLVINRKNMAPADCCAGNDACLSLLCPDVQQEDNDDFVKDDNVMDDLIPTAVTTSAPDVSNE